MSSSVIHPTCENVRATAVATWGRMNCKALMHLVRWIWIANVRLSASARELCFGSERCLGSVGSNPLTRSTFAFVSSSSTMGRYWTCASSPITALVGKVISRMRNVCSPNFRRRRRTSARSKRRFLVMYMYSYPWGPDIGWKARAAAAILPREGVCPLAGRCTLVRSAQVRLGG